MCEFEPVCKPSENASKAANSPVELFPDVEGGRTSSSMEWIPDSLQFQPQVNSNETKYYQSIVSSFNMPLEVWGNTEAVIATLWIR